eukprot:23228-Prorocentrum_minimum.AAC.1
MFGRLSGRWSILHGCICRQLLQLKYSSIVATAEHVREASGHAGGDAQRLKQHRDLPEEIPVGEERHQGTLVRVLEGVVPSGEPAGPAVVPAVAPLEYLSSRRDIRLLLLRVFHRHLAARDDVQLVPQLPLRPPKQEPLSSQLSARR